MMLVDLDTHRSAKISALNATSHDASFRHSLTFSKNELNAILSIYSFQVAKGKWRDYAMDFLKQMAVFSIFRHSSEQPLVSIVKTRGNTASGYIYELFFEKKRIARSGDLAIALQNLRDKL